MAGGSGTTIIGWDSNTEVGNTILGGPSGAGDTSATQLAAIASGTPNTGWVKMSAIDTDLILCVWDATSGNIIIQSNILTTANQNATSGHWCSISLATTTALTNGTTYVIGVQQHGNYWSIRNSATTIKYWAQDQPGTWPTPPNVSAYVYSNNIGLASLYFSSEPITVPLSYFVIG